MTPLSIPASKPSSAGVDAKEAVDSSTWKSPIRGSEHGTRAIHRVVHGIDSALHCIVVHRERHKIALE